jgi:RNA 3'-terminal phosphate cyclase (ATP)
MITLDGRMGEGGGQVLRSSLTLSMLTGKAFRLENVRGGRDKPGLLRQHLTCVNAAAAISNAKVKGAELRSGQLTFIPGAVNNGSYEFAIGTAGSTTLVLQTVLLPLALAKGDSSVTVSGGTHNGKCPSAHNLKHAFLPAMERLGVSTELSIDRFGFYPAGGGQLTLLVAGGATIGPIDLCDRGDGMDMSVCAVVSDLPKRIANRELTVLRERLNLHRKAGRVESVDHPMGPGNAVWVVARTPALTEVFSAVGEKRMRAEDVADHLADQVVEWRDSEAVVGEYLADQLLIPLALGGGAFTTVKPSLHTTTNMDVIQRFLDVVIRTQEVSPKKWRISRA